MEEAFILNSNKIQSSEKGQGFSVRGDTLPECFFNQAVNNRETPLSYTKINGEWIPKTYQESLDFVFKTIAGLKALQFKAGEKIIILAENRWEWILTDYAAQWLGGATAAIYITSTAQEIDHIIENSEARIFFISNQNMLNRLDGVKRLKDLRAIIAWDKIEKPANFAAPLFSLSEFLKPGISETEAKQLLKTIDPLGLCILIYTSGTTGESKGVMLNHRALVTNIRCMLDGVPVVRSGKKTISFLPLSHIFERTLHNLFCTAGIKIYFAESIDLLVKNLGEVKPEILMCVPRIFEKMYAKIMEQMKNTSYVKKNIFAWASFVGSKCFSYRYEKKRLPLKWHLAYEIADLLVFKKLRSITGGNAEVFVSGGAPLSKEIAQFFFRSGFTILEGYGISEACMLSVNRIDNFRFGTVGLPFDGVEMKIAEDGEIIVKGPSVMMGYLKRPDLTAEVMDSEGWFHTGDIGERDADGFFRITDRKKELIVTAGGKKIAPQPIENSLKKDALIESVCLVGDTKKFISALIVPNLEFVRTWAYSKSLSLRTLGECAHSKELREHFQREIEEVNAQLPRYSTIKDFRILPQSFSIETGEFTPTLKLKRRVIQTKFARIIDEMYPSDLE